MYTMARWIEALVLCSVLLSVAAQLSVLSVEPRATTARQGESVSFRCRVLSGSQPVNLEWKKNNNQPLPDNVKIGPDGSVLTIANTRPNNSGQYRCVATNSGGRATATGTLIVRISPKLRVTPPGPLHLRVGEPVSLECHATGRPRPSIIWKRQGSNLQLAVVTTEDGNTMRLAAVKAEDSGVYICQAENSEGVAEIKVELTVEGGQIVTLAPVASVTAEEVTAVAGQKVIMECQATGSPTPDIVWSKLRAPLPWKHSMERGVLTLTSVGRQDSGQYICNATNIHGYSQAFTQLEVDSPPYTTILPDQVRLRPGDALRLQCLAHGSHPIRFRWSRAGGLSMPAGAESTKDGQLRIGQLRLTDTGTYKCVATNHVGSSEARVKVTVKV